MQKYKYCSQCGKELETEYYTFRDNYLQVKYFEEIDGSDNAFCSSECACEALMLECLENKEE